jgi:hypothetical protein
LVFSTRRMCWKPPSETRAILSQQLRVTPGPQTGLLKALREDDPVEPGTLRMAQVDTTASPEASPVP